MRRKYGRFAKSRDAHTKDVSLYEAEVIIGERIATQTLVNNVLNPIVRIKELYDAPQCVRISGMLLQRASFAACILGDDASIGDLEFHLRNLQQDYLWEEGIVSPKMAFEEYKNGNRTHLLLFLNALLDQAATRFLSLRPDWLARNSSRHAHSIWCSESGMPPAIDASILNTHYHLYSSLLRLVELEPGNA